MVLPSSWCAEFKKEVFYNFSYISRISQNILSNSSPAIKVLKCWHNRIRHFKSIGVLQYWGFVRSSVDSIERYQHVSSKNWKSRYYSWKLGNTLQVSDHKRHSSNPRLRESCRFNVNVQHSNIYAPKLRRRDFLIVDIIESRKVLKRRKCRSGKERRNTICKWVACYWRWGDCWTRNNERKRFVNSTSIIMINKLNRRVLRDCAFGCSMGRFGSLSWLGLFKINERTGSVKVTHIMRGYKRNTINR